MGKGDMRFNKFLVHFDAVLRFSGVVALLLSCSVAQAQSLARIQGSDHISPYAGKKVTTEGIITLWRSKGFYFQSETADADPSTAEGAFVFLGSAEEAKKQRTLNPTGSLVKVSGTVTEFKPVPMPPILPWRLSIKCGTTNVSAVRPEDRRSFRTITQIYQVTALSNLGNRKLPAPIAFSPPGATGLQPIADVAGAPFDPSKYPRDYFEAHEGMRMVVKSAVTAGLKLKNWSSYWVYSAQHLSNKELSADGSPIHQVGHIYPEIVEVGNAFRQPRFAMSSGANLGDLVGVMSYKNGRYFLQLETKISKPTVIAPRQDTVVGVSASELTVASYNLWNLDPHIESHTRPAGFNDQQFRLLKKTDDIGDGRFRAMAKQIVLRLKSPDIIALQEVQDNDGKEITSVVAADKTLKQLVADIEAAGGPVYSYHTLSPRKPHSDGGQPGGNIQNAFLVRTDKKIMVESLERLFDADGDNCASDKGAFYQGRKPLLLRLSYNGQAYLFLNVHLKSKLGDQGPYSIEEDPKPITAEKRLAQAKAIVAYLEKGASSATERVVVLGDFNDHLSSRALEPFRSSTLNFVFAEDSRGPGYMVSHEFGGVGSAIDFIAVGSRNSGSISQAMYVSGNVGNLDRLSDHNPVWLA
ncbi:MAG: endonuclease/exonuclease/phosphatase family protein, partial [Pseudomonadota bacterium]